MLPAHDDDDVPPIGALAGEAEPVETPAPAGTRANEDRFDAKRAALYLADQWRDAVAHSPGRGWLTRGESGLWRVHAEGIAVRNRIRRMLATSNLAMRSVRTGDVAHELADELHVPADRWDAGDVLGLPSGRVLDLDSGETRAPRDDELISRRLSVDPEPGEPALWLRLLEELFSELADPGEVIRYVRAWLRYSLGTSCRDESILFVTGPPGSGKSTLFDAWARIAGDYATVRDGDRLAAGHAQHLQWLVGLAGNRVLRVSELPSGGRWDAGRICALASGEAIEANPMRGSSIAFKSRTKMIITSNHRPRGNPASGIFRRLRLIPAAHVPPARDLTLKERLRDEAGRILQWAIDGPREIPAVPTDIRRETGAYKAESDELGEWLAERVALDPNGLEPNPALWRDYTDWCSECGREGRDRLSQRAFNAALTERFGAPFAHRPTGGKTARFRRGVRLVRVTQVT